VVVSRPTEEIESLVNQVADSETFRAAPVMRRLLLYLWQHHSETVSEYAIAIDALGRPLHFDPKTDATVRVQVARLRAKLEEFYKKEGERFPLLLSIPLGGHEIRWSYSQSQPSFLSTFSALPLWYRNVLLSAAIITSVLMVLCLVLLFENRNLRATLPPEAPPPARFWQSFLKDGKPTVVVVPSTVHFRWPDQGLYIMDLKVSEFPGWKTSPLLLQLAGKWGPPQLNQSFIFARDMFGSFSLREYLDKLGHQVPVIEAPNYAADSLATRNTIFLGVPSSSDNIRQLLEKTNFYVAKSTEPALVRSRKAGPNEPSEYQETVLSPKRKICPGMIVLLPARPEGTRCLLLVGRWVTAMTSMLESAVGLKLLDEQWSRAGSPDAWEMVVQAEIESDTTIVRVWPVAFRRIPASFWK